MWTPKLLYYYYYFNHFETQVCSFQDVYVLSEDEGLILAAVEHFVDENENVRVPGDQLVKYILA